MVFQQALDRQCQVVVTGAFAVARAGDGILACLMVASVGIRTGCNDANRLAFKHREGHHSEVEHDVVRGVVGAELGAAHIAVDVWPVLTPTRCSYKRSIFRPWNSSGMRIKR